MRSSAAWVGRALRQRATVEGNYVLTRARRWWYTGKAVACLLLRREDLRSRHHVHWSEPDPIEIAYGEWSTTYHPEFGDGAEGEVLRVGWGVRRGWRFSVIWTGYP